MRGMKNFWPKGEVDLIDYPGRGPCILGSIAVAVWYLGRYYIH